MKCLSRIIFILFFLTLFYSYSSTVINLREKRRNNGFRVLMAKGYIDDISDFIMAFLKTTKIQENVKTLATCINDLIKTFSSLSLSTQHLNDSPSITSFMGVISTFNQVYKDASRNNICADASKQFTEYVYTFINDPRIGRRDSVQYFKDIRRIIENENQRVYFELVKSANSFRNKECYKSGERLGDLFYSFLQCRQLSNDPRDFEGYNQLITDRDTFGNDAALFKTRFSSCLDSIQKIIPDINDFYAKDHVIGEEIIPTISDLVKSIFETNDIMKCFDGVSKILKDLRETNYRSIVSFSDPTLASNGYGYDKSIGTNFNKNNGYDKNIGYGKDTVQDKGYDYNKSTYEKRNFEKREQQRVKGNKAKIVEKVEVKVVDKVNSKEKKTENKLNIIDKVEKKK